MTHEINRLTQGKAGDPSAYGALLEIVRATAHVDIIAGTSAGGINGAFLTLANVYRRDLTSLGGLWARRERVLPARDRAGAAGRPLVYAAAGPAHLAPLATVAAWWKRLLVLGVLAYAGGGLFVRQRASTTAS